MQKINQRERESDIFCYCKVGRAILKKIATKHIQFQFYIEKKNQIDKEWG